MRAVSLAMTLALPRQTAGSSSAAAEAIVLGLLVLPDARVHLAPYLLLFLAGAAVSLLAARILSASRLTFLLLLRGSPSSHADCPRAGSVRRRVPVPLGRPRGRRRDLSLRAASERSRRRRHRSRACPARGALRCPDRVPSGGAGGVPRLRRRVCSVEGVLRRRRSLDRGASLERRRRRASAAALYAFHPLAITESAGEGHLDSLGVALLLACLAHLARGRRASAGIAFALSVLTKYISLVAAIPLLRRGRSRFLAAAALCAAALWLAASRPGASPWAASGNTPRVGISIHRPTPRPSG